MSAENSTIKERLQQFKTNLWPIDQFHEWYGLDVEDVASQKILTQIGLFAGTHGEPSSFGADPFSHWHFELYLQRRELVPIRLAAAELAMSVEDFNKVIEAFKETPGCQIVGSPGESTSFVRRSFLRDFHKGFDRLQRTIFSSHPSYILKLHHEIESDLNVKISTKLDAADEALKLKSPLPGHQIDCLTNKFISTGNDVYLQTGKPMQLAPDCCSILTYAKHQEDLESSLLGSAPVLDEGVLEALRDS